MGARWRRDSHTWESNRSASRAAWILCVGLAVVSVAACVGFAIYYGLKVPAAPPRQYYYTIRGPRSIFLQAPTQAVLAKAVHGALALPSQYPTNCTSVWIVRDLAANATMATVTDIGNATMLMNSNKSQPQAADVHLRAQDQHTQQQQQQERLKQPNSTAANNSSYSVLLFGFRLFPGPGFPDQDSIQSVIAGVDSNAAVLLYLVTGRVIDPAALGQIAAGFTDEEGNLLGQSAGTVDPAISLDKDLLQYPPRSMPAGACTCRHGWNMTRIPMDCPSPWESLAGTNHVAPALTIKDGALSELHTGQPAVLHGVNWFGWNVGNFNPDGLWAFCDDNSTQTIPVCQEDGDIPGYASIGYAGAKLLNISYWGRRTMTNDFATVVYRLKILGFNAVRLQFRFSDLNLDLPVVGPGVPTENAPCLMDSNVYIVVNKSLDPQISGTLDSSSTSLADSLHDTRQHVPKYLGMPHPPPKTGNPQCDNKPWSVPFTRNYTSQLGKTLNLRMCNWYLPQGPGVPAVYRFLWQVQYLVSQGFYVLLDFSPTGEREPNLESPELLAQNWGNLWRMLIDIPAYKKLMAGRLFPDLVNEPSRYGCQWDIACNTPDNQRACAPTLHSFGLAAAAIWRWDPNVLIFINGLGQDHSTRWEQCGGSFPGMNWGDGFITDKDMLQQYDIGNPTRLLQAVSKMSGGGLVLAPHLYPASITSERNPYTQLQQTVSAKWDLSWGFKTQGTDSDAEGSALPVYPVVVGEFGARDDGLNNVTNTDTTMFSEVDRNWLLSTAEYLRDLGTKTHRPVSWFFWTWNANSADTQGLVGPQTTWREVQWTKVRILTKEFGLRPWYCNWQPEMCASLHW